MRVPQFDADTTSELVRNLVIPPRPAIMNQLMALCSNPDMSLMDVADVIATDVGLSSAVLKAANSPFFGASRSLTSIHQAVSLLGVRNLLFLVQGLLLLDEAYIDFCAAGERQGVLPATARLRTLSKAHGLAGLRVGYAIAPEEWIAKTDQIRTQFAVSSVAQAAAVAALDAPHCSERLIAETLALRDALAAALLQRGLQLLPSHTNFVAIVYPDADSALARQKALLAQGVAVHRPPHPSMQHVLRVTAHPDALQDKVLQALT